MCRWVASWNLLVPFPQHASNVLLILNTHNRGVSPQFHCIYDNEFAAFNCDAKFSSLWKIKAKL